MGDDAVGAGENPLPEDQADEAELVERLFETDAVVKAYGCPDYRTWVVGMIKGGFPVALIKKYEHLFEVPPKKVEANKAKGSGDIAEPPNKRSRSNEQNVPLLESPKLPSYNDLTDSNPLEDISTSTPVVPEIVWSTEKIDEVLKGKKPLAREQMKGLPERNEAFFGVWKLVERDQGNGKDLTFKGLKAQHLSSIKSILAQSVSDAHKWQQVIDHLKRSLHLFPNTPAVTYQLQNAIGTRTEVQPGPDMLPWRYVHTLELAHTLGANVMPEKPFEVNENKKVSGNFIDFQSNYLIDNPISELHRDFVNKIQGTALEKAWFQVPEPLVNPKTLQEILIHCRKADILMEKVSPVPINPLNPNGREYKETEKEIEEEKSRKRKRGKEREKEKTNRNPPPPQRCDACGFTNHVVENCRRVEAFHRHNPNFRYNESHAKRYCFFHGANNTHNTIACVDKKKFCKDPYLDWSKHQDVRFRTPTPPRERGRNQALDRYDRRERERSRTPPRNENLEERIKRLEALNGMNGSQSSN